MKPYFVLILLFLVVAALSQDNTCNWKASVGPIQMCIGYVTIDRMSDIQTAIIKMEKRRTTLKDLLVTIDCMEIGDDPINSTVFLAGDTMEIQYNPLTFLLTILKNEDIITSRTFPEETFDKITDFLRERTTNAKQAS
jgi:hypothetical protein